MKKIIIEHDSFTEIFEYGCFGGEGFPPLFAFESIEEKFEIAPNRSPIRRIKKAKLLTKPVEV